MSQQTRTPRQRQGDGLVPLVIRVTPKMRELIQRDARARDQSEAEVIRVALSDYFYGGRGSC